MSLDSFAARRRLRVGADTYDVYGLSSVVDEPGRLPYSVRILLENLLRHEDGEVVRDVDVRALVDHALGRADARGREIAFMPARVLMQDFTGVPAIVDLAGMRDAIAAGGGDVARVTPEVPVDLVIDHSIVADVAGRSDAFAQNAALEYERNRERYEFLRWAQGAFSSLRVFPPNRGICHQVNLEHLAPVVFRSDDGVAYPDTLVGTDSHTPMVNGLGVLGWGVGGIEAEAAMLGQPFGLLIPAVVGIELSGELTEGSTATDLVLTVADLLRKHGVVGKFVEFFGAGVSRVPLENRATIGNMSPEYGSTCTMFPIDDETLRYLRATGRADAQVALVEAYAKDQGLWHEPSITPRYDEVLALDLTTVEPSLAGPARPQDRVSLGDARREFHRALLAFREGDVYARADVAGTRLPIGVHAGSPEEASADSFPASDPPVATEGAVARGEPDTDGPPVVVDPQPVVELRRAPVARAGADGFDLADGHVVIAAITSCTNTSNPSVMVAAGLLAKNAVARGLRSAPWVKTSLAPGSLVVTDYLDRAGLSEPLAQLGFQLVGYGCTTCIGNSGPLAPDISEAITTHELSAVSVLSGNRNFEGRIHPDCRMNYLASPPLVVAYALAGTIDTDLRSDPLGHDAEGRPVYLRDLWPSSAEITDAVAAAIDTDMYHERYGTILEGDERWRSLPAPVGDRYAWSEQSTYIRRPPFYEEQPDLLTDVVGARVLVLLGDSVTTDHISPAGTIRRDGPAARWLEEHGVAPRDFNSFGSRRGNHEVMVRGTFANVRLRNQLAPGTEGGVTRHLPSGEEMSIYDASVRYQSEGTPLVVLAGAEYGSGSSRDWAAKGSRLLGIRAVVAQSYERIHRSNLVGMGVLPLEFVDGDSVASLGLTGEEEFEIRGLGTLADDAPFPRRLRVSAGGISFEVRARIDTASERDVFARGGILPFTLARLAR